MWEIACLCAAAVIMALMYRGTAHPKMNAFINTLAGAVSLVVTEVMFSGGLDGITVYSAALSVILGVPGTIAHRLFCMM